MGKKKSAAQIKRMMKRAEKRGESYVYNPPPNDGDDEAEELSEHQQHHLPDNDNNDESNSDKDIILLLVEIAQKLQSELDSIDDSEMKSKDRRSAKRKANAIAMESMHNINKNADDTTDTDILPKSSEELLERYGGGGGDAESKEEQEQETKNDNDDDDEKKKGDKEQHHNKNPYIVFVGQLSYETTKQGLFEHIRKELSDEHTVNQNTVRIRLLTDPKKQNRSRGMAFVELSNPELLYACLKLHRTQLDDRRINVERSVGGGKHSETRKSKLQQLRHEQERYMETTVQTMLQEHIKNGEIQIDELDDGVVSLCRRHTATIVQAAFERYIESNGHDMDNPSAYFSFLLTKLATEGIYTGRDDNDNDDNKKNNKKKNSNNNRQGGSSGGKSNKRLKTNAVGSSSSSQNNNGNYGPLLK